jgi:hypothetical protein
MINAHIKLDSQQKGKLISSFLFGVICPPSLSTDCKPYDRSVLIFYALLQKNASAHEVFEPQR